MADDFQVRTLRGLGKEVRRLGLSASYRPGRQAVERALDAGLNFLFCYGFDTQMLSVVRALAPSQRQQCVIATGAYNLVWFHPNLRRSLEKRLRQLHTDYLDLFLFLGLMGKEQFIAPVLEEMHRFREEGKVRAIGVSTHDRQLAGRLASEGTVDALMIRYNAAHRGAERDVFPHLAAHQPVVINHTATRWAHLLRRPPGWPRDGRVPTAGMCYRFVLSNLQVGVCLTAPRSERELEENLAAVEQGPLSEEEMDFMREFGDAVYRAKKWFM